MKQKAKQRRLRPNISAKGPVKVPTVELAANPTMYLKHNKYLIISLETHINKKQYGKLRVPDH